MFQTSVAAHLNYLVWTIITINTHRYCIPMMRFLERDPLSKCKKRIRALTSYLSWYNYYIISKSTLLIVSLLGDGIDCCDEEVRKSQWRHYAWLGLTLFAWLSSFEVLTSHISYSERILPYAIILGSLFTNTNRHRCNACILECS